MDLCKANSHIQQTAVAAKHLRLSTISKTNGVTILNEAEIKPFRIKYYCEKRDPEFVAKKHNVLVLYKQISRHFDEAGNLIPYEGDEPNTHTISYDEKMGIQAIASTTPDLQP